MKVYEQQKAKEEKIFKNLEWPNKTINGNKEKII